LHYGMSGEAVCDRTSLRLPVKTKLGVYYDTLVKNLKFRFWHQMHC